MYKSPAAGKKTDTKGKLTSDRHKSVYTQEKGDQREISTQTVDTGKDTPNPARQIKEKVGKLASDRH